MNSQPIDILLVEDSAGDVELVREGLRRSKLVNTLHVASDGVEAMSFLNAEDKPRPDLVLLDINLPKMNGHEVLGKMRSDDRFKLIPVVVLTTSNHDVDVLRAYEEQASAYVQKPLTANDFIDVVSRIESFWISIVKLPPKKLGNRQ